MNEKVKVKIILKSGYEIVITCRKFSIKRCIDGSIAEYSFDGLDTNKSLYPLHIDAKEIAAIVQCPNESENM